MSRRRRRRRRAPTVHEVPPAKFVIDRIVWALGLVGFMLLCGVLYAFGAQPPPSCLAAPSLPAVHGATTLVCHKAYASLVDDTAKVPRFVTYTLTGPHTLGCDLRANDFHEDPALPAGSARPSDYARSGYDKGHQAPAEDFAWNTQAEDDSFSMANMAPQKPGLNRQEWERLEETARAWAWASGPLDIYVGPVLTPSDRHIGKDRVDVPKAFWKIVRGKAGTLAFMMANKMIHKGPLAPYQTTVAAIAHQTGIAFGFHAGKTRLWPVNLKGWHAAHKNACK